MSSPFSASTPSIRQGLRRSGVNVTTLDDGLVREVTEFSRDTARNDEFWA